MQFKPPLFQIGSVATAICQSGKGVPARFGDLKRQQKQKASLTVSSLCTV